MMSGPSLNASTVSSSRVSVERGIVAGHWRVVVVLLVALSFLAACGHEAESGPRGQSKPTGDSTTHYQANDPLPGQVQNVAHMQAIAQLPKPTGPLPAGATCITPACHTRFATAAHLHGPVSEGACSACHQDDTGGHHYPLKRDRTKTCTFCHAVVGTQLHQHGAIEKDGCTVCHDPHVSPVKFLLTADNVGGVCVKCHQLPLKKSAHRPFADGQCTLCHLPHQSDTKFLLRGGDGPAHCLACHQDMAKKLATATHVHKPVTESCLTCHGPHATDNSHQLKVPLNNTCLSCHPQVQKQLASIPKAHGAMLEPDGCATCHDPHASDQPAILRQRMDKVCLTCHDKPVKSADGRVVPSVKPELMAANLHGPVRAGDCSECHSPHGSVEANLLKQPFPKTFYASFDLKNYALCFKCHDQQLVLKGKTDTLTNFRDGDKNLHFAHVNRAEKGRTCKTCHAIHGSDLPKHIATDVPFENSQWAMPINFEQTAAGGHCAPACHEPLGYDRKNPLNENRTPATTQGAP